MSISQHFVSPGRADLRMTSGIGVPRAEGVKEEDQRVEAIPGVQTHPQEQERGPEEGATQLETSGKSSAARLRRLPRACAAVSPGGVVRDRL